MTRDQVRNFIRNNPDHPLIQKCREGRSQTVSMDGHAFGRGEVLGILWSETAPKVEIIDPPQPAPRRRALRFAPTPEDLRQQALRAQAIENLTKAKDKEDAILAEMARIEARSQAADASTANVIRNTDQTPLPTDTATAPSDDDAERVLGQIRGVLRDALAFDGAKLGRINTLVNAYYKGRPRR